MSGEPNPLPRLRANYAKPRRAHHFALSIPAGLDACELDRERAVGADMACDPLLARDAYQLASASARHRLARSSEGAVRRAEALPEGMPCAEYRLRKQPEKEPSSWLHIPARVLAVAAYHAGLVQPYRRG
jgi:hypothetical protein